MSLVSIPEYFKGMFSSPWMESNWVEKSIKIQMPSRVLEIILDFAYTDQAQALQGISLFHSLCISYSMLLCNMI